jgi:hypothetical protein
LAEITREMMMMTNLSRRALLADDFKIWTTIAGVNMRLGPGGVREFH